jgi:hypothetical protein
MEQIRIRDGKNLDPDPQHCFRQIIVPVGMIALVIANFYAGGEAFCTHLQRWVALRTRDSHPAAEKTIAEV